MMRFLKPRAATVAAIACGAAVSSGSQYGIWLAALVPAIFMSQGARRQSVRMAVLYYLGASWPIVVVCRNYVRSGGGLWVGLLLWVAASGALAAPWFWAWAPRSIGAVWQAPVAILLTAVPPLGIIGWAHPFLAAGILFPGSRWLGLVATLLLPGLLIARPRHTFAAYAPAVLLLNGFCGNACSAPHGWAAVDTHFGDVAGSILNEYVAAQWVWYHSQTSSAQVLLYPESVVPHWTSASVSFWSEGRDYLLTSGKTILLGAQISSGNDRATAAEFDDAIRVLRSESPTPRAGHSTTGSYRNVLIYLDRNGWHSFDQHVPVLLAMWKPFVGGGVRINWQPNLPVKIAGERVCILICYEALIAWPALSSLPYGPTVICVIANNYWTAGTPIAKLQSSVVKSWSRLFRTPYLMASNQ